MIIKNYAIDFAFEVIGPYKEFEDIPLASILAAARKRLDSLDGLAESEALEAFGSFDVHTESGEEDDDDDET